MNTNSAPSGKPGANSKSQLLLPSTAEEYEWAERIMVLLDQHAQLNDDLNLRLEVQAGSSLKGDDNVSPAIPLSYYLRYLLIAASDNFSALRSMLIKKETEAHIDLALHPFAPYTLVRNVLDCAGTAYWVLSPTSRPHRIHRHAMLELEDAKKNRSAVNQYGGAGEETYLRRVELIKAMIARYPEHITWKSVTDGFAVTAALTEVGTAPPFKGINPLGAWQLASGMAHGKRWAGLVLSDKEPANNNNGIDSDTYRVTGSYKHLWWLMNTAHIVLTEAQKLFTERGTSHLKLSPASEP